MAVSDALSQPEAYVYTGPLLTKIEAARYLAVSVRTLERLTSCGEILPVPIGSDGASRGRGKNVRYSRKALDNWIERRELEAAGYVMEATPT